MAYSVLKNVFNEGVQSLLHAHLMDMRRVSPPCSTHALDLEGLKHPSVSFYSFWEGKDLVGVGALKTLTHEALELKSMRVKVQGQGTGAKILTFLLQEANAGLEGAKAELEGAKVGRKPAIYLETGSAALAKLPHNQGEDYFLPARRLYERFGFMPIPPFGAYKEDPLSCFYKKEL